MRRAIPVLLGMLCVLALSVVSVGGHHRRGGKAPGDVASPVAEADPAASVAAPAPASAPSPPPVAVEAVPIDGDLPAFVVRARADAASRPPMLFIPGMCVHPGGYVQAFQYAAAARGDLVTLQGDVSCGGNGFARRWSGDLEAMDRRIATAFRASGLGEPHDVVVIGYSQGAERAERLVARWPERYTSAVIIASPIVPWAPDFARSRGVVFVAGTLDAQAAMRGAVAPFRRAGIRATFVPLPGARHGQMGETPEESMAQALDFLRETQNVNKGEGAPSHGPGLERWTLHDDHGRAGPDA